MTTYTVPQIVDLVRSPKTSRDQAIVLIERLCTVACTEGTIIGSRQTGALLTRTFDAMLGGRAS